MDDNEFAANIELGSVYLDVMAQVVEEGFDFIAPELERWQEFGQSLLFRGDLSSQTSRASPNFNPANRGTLDSPGDNKGDNFGLGIIWEIDPETGSKKDIVVELDGSYFDSFSLEERVTALTPLRCIILYADRIKSYKIVCA